VSGTIRRCSRSPFSKLAPSRDLRRSVTVTIPAANSQAITIPITLTIASLPAGASIAATPTALLFSFQQGGDAPASQQINVNSTGGALNVAASVATGSQWLAVTPASVRRRLRSPYP